MAIHRTALFAIFIVLLLIPLTSFTPTVAYKQAQTSSQTQLRQDATISNGTTSIPLSLPSVISSSISLGTVDPSTQVSLGIVLPQRDEVGLQQYISAVASPTSRLYHDYLSTQEYSRLYGPSSSEANALASFLSSRGLVVSFDKSNANLLIVSGSAANTEKALHVSIGSFKTGSTAFYSATSNLTLPSEFSNIRTVFGLTNYGSEKNVTATPMYKVFGALNSTQASSASVYYSPSEIGQVYNATSLWNAGYNGSGISIAIVDAYGDPYIQQELDNFSAEFHLPSTTINEICVDGPCDYAKGITAGWSVEIALDVEWAHAMAPAARINLYIGSNATFPLFDAVQKAVSDGVNSIISLSWGEPENAFDASSPVAPVYGVNYPWLDQVFQQAAAQGITVFASSGDWGAYDQALGETLPYGGAVYPATDPYVTAVGGTTLFMNSTSGYAQLPYADALGGYGTETAWSWNNLENAATGGGYSTLFGTPPWQNGPGYNGSTRGVPDVAWEGDPQTGVTVAISNGPGQGFTYYIVGGTSVGSPSWAGSLALIDQKEGGGMGLIDPAIYSILNNPSEYSKVFHDVTIGNNNPYAAGAGWDPLTGIGSPNLGELANYLAHTGSLDVSVQNGLSGASTESYSYGSAITLTAKITSGSAIATGGTVTADLIGPAGQKIATNIPFTYSSTSKTWSGQYTIKPTDSAGMWTAKVSATTGSSSGTGSTIFSVGDGVTIFQPFYNATTNTDVPLFVVPGETINVSALVTSPSGQCCVSSGEFNAIFTLNSPSGKLEGKVPLTYGLSSQDWSGSFKVPNSADQGSWVLTVSGTDSGGNSASAYSWLNVGLNVLLSTDSSSYILGDNVTILSAPIYPNGFITAVGNFTATISSGPKIIAEVPMSFNWLYALWTGTFTLSQSYPTGFYNITVSGNDGAGVSGSFSTIIRVAPYNLAARISLPSSSISIDGGSVPTVSAHLTYPGGAVMKAGNVEAFVSLDMGGTLVPVDHLRLTYQASSQSFVGPNVLAPASPLGTDPGKYVVTIQAIDSSGNAGTFTTSFFVEANPHPPISISSDSQFIASNGVIKGSGTASDPYIIAGWNTSSISVSNGVNSSYEIVNSWAEGGSGNGITIDSPNSANILLSNDTAVSNHGNGLAVSNVSNVVISRILASNNTLSGIAISQVPSGLGGLLSSVATNNGADGVDLVSVPFYTISSTAATGNEGDGFYIFNSKNSTLFSDNATSNNIGAEITGVENQSYGGIQIVGGYYQGNNVGIEANGMGQSIESNSAGYSLVVIYRTAQIGNKIGTLALNDSALELEASAIGLNSYGVVIQNSLPLVLGNIITEDSGTGLNITGSYRGNAYCEVHFTNFTIADYKSCVGNNYVTLNGAFGLSMSDLNGSFTYQNAALGNGADGFHFDSVTSSVISNQTSIYNLNNGMTVADSSNSKIDGNLAGGNLNGLEIKNSVNNTIDLNNATLNFFDGLLLSDSRSNLVSNNVAIEDASGCSALTHCSAASGIELSNSSSNIISQNTVTNNTSTALASGIYINSGSSGNSVLLNNATLNYAGILISSSSGNEITKNSLHSSTYGIYLLDSPDNTISNNEYVSVKQELYPNQPSVEFVGIANGTSYSGLINLTWTVSGQGISQESLVVDGKSTVVSGTTFQLNTALLSDKTHTITINVTDVGGFSAASSVFISTRNHEGLSITTLGPGGVPLSDVSLNLKGPGGTLNTTTGSNGTATFNDLSAGNYVASASINGTLASVPVNFNMNSSISIDFPTLITTIEANASGKAIPITMQGSIISSEVSNVQFNNANGVYSLSFVIQGLSAPGSATLTIPKSILPAGPVPQVYVNGSSVNTEYSENSQNYYITLTAAQGSTSVLIQFSRVVSLNLDFVVILVIVVALIAAGVSLAIRRPRRRYDAGLP